MKIQNTRKRLFAQLSIAVLAVIVSGSLWAGGDDKQPNIILILADDLGYGDIGAYGNEVIQTLNIDQLAHDGVQFDNGYVSHPTCSPSRAGLMTGRNQPRHGWEFNPAGRDRVVGMSTETPTIAERLKDEGYATALVGKWHLGSKKEHHPLSRGFDEFFGILSGGSVFIDSDTPGVEYGSIAGEPAPSVPNNRFRGFEKVQVEEYLTDRFTDEAIDFIEREKDNPFFLYLSHTTPHTPLQATAEYLEPYKHIKDKRTRVYAAMVASLDESVGQVIETLREQNLLENTMIVFTSDNGCAGYIRGACSNAPLSGHKRYHLEGGIRVPFILRWDQGTKTGDFEYPVSTLDLSATFLAAAGGDGTTEDSVNLLPFINGQKKSAPHDYLYWKAGPTAAIRGDRWKLLRMARFNPQPELERDAVGRLIPPKGGWVAADLMAYDTFLYDLENDRSETTNLATHHPERVAELSALLDVWLEDAATDAIIPPLRSRTAERHGNEYQLFF
ncbi:MAG: sulfatase-like hydrolase/transferase [Pseudomonadales bacterium]|nr:sulfatase-like hydrolase/transferase [Pseudomonadales bacterium]